MPVTGTLRRGQELLNRPVISGTRRGIVFGCRFLHLCRSSVTYTYPTFPGHSKVLLALHLGIIESVARFGVQSSPYDGECKKESSPIPPVVA